MARAWATLPVGVRQELARALQKETEVNNTVDFLDIFRMALKDPDPTVRTYAIRGLIEVEDIRLIPPLVELLKEADDITTQVAAAQALANFVLLGELQKIRPRPFETVRQALANVYNDRDRALQVRRRALEALAYTAVEGVPEMVSEAYTHPNEEMRASAVLAMGRSADKRWAEVVKKELQNSNPVIRYEATKACGELELRETVLELVDLVEDADTEVQEAALWSLGQIGGNMARRTLERYMTSEDKSLRRAAEAALGELEFFHGDLTGLFGPPETFLEDSDWDNDEHTYDEDEPNL